MGTRPRTRQGPPHERDHDVYVRKYPSDFQHHDGLHAIQESLTRYPADESGFHKI